MAGRVYSQDGDIIVENSDGGDQSSLVKRPVLLTEQEQTITIPGVTVTFPKPRSTQVYGYSIGITEIFGVTQRADSCCSAACWPAQEWGPNGVGLGTFTNDLPPIVIGVVPEGINYLDISLQFTRTKNPSRYKGSAVDGNAGIVIPPGHAGKIVRTLEGSALFEAIGPLRRTIWIGLVGGNIVLYRFQSIAQADPSQYPSSWVEQSFAIGWSHHGGAGSDQPNLVWEISRDQVFDDGVFSTTGQCRRFGPRSCSFVDNSDFESIYTGNVIIRPGYIKT